MCINTNSIFCFFFFSSLSAEYISEVDAGETAKIIFNLFFEKFVMAQHPPEIWITYYVGGIFSIIITIVSILYCYFVGGKEKKVAVAGSPLVLPFLC